ncbi:DUF742 domain-containing protein [Streptomyces sp. ODS28]|uniref:DUF742 domain-containing protein n=1 Tax=Streptomyces sp. ODS28 TaxID=3136688 RepID=UPI0031EBBAD1
MDQRQFGQQAPGQQVPGQAAPGGPGGPGGHGRHPGQHGPQGRPGPQQQPQQPPFGQPPHQAPPQHPHASQQPQSPQPYEQAPPPRIQPVQPAKRPDPGTGAGPRGEQQPLVRPYAMTGGRTRPRYQLAIEALVHTSADSAQLQGQLPEHQRICRLCYEIKSVAEISALLTIPLGVARILVADLAEAGLVAIHQPGGDGTNADGQPDVTLLERVLSGLRKL